MKTKNKTGVACSVTPKNIKALRKPMTNQSNAVKTLKRLGFTELPVTLSGSREFVKGKTRVSAIFGDKSVRIDRFVISKNRHIGRALFTAYNLSEVEALIGTKN